MIENIWVGEKWNIERAHVLGRVVILKGCDRKGAKMTFEKRSAECETWR